MTSHLHVLFISCHYLDQTVVFALSVATILTSQRGKPSPDLFTPFQVSQFYPPAAL